jgi:hypothetical protein
VVDVGPTVSAVGPPDNEGQERRLAESNGGAGRAPIFTEDRIVRALSQLNDGVHLRSGSVMFLGATRGVAWDPFSGGFLASVEERRELTRRLRLLEPRDRVLLYLWYTARWQVTAIAQHIGISRVHCYRLRDRAMLVMTTGDRGRGSDRDAPPVMIR